jgi:hypothetical protein
LDDACGDAFADAGDGESCDLDGGRSPVDRPMLQEATSKEAASS